MNRRRVIRAFVIAGLVAVLSAVAGAAWWGAATRRVTAGLVAIDGERAIVWSRGSDDGVAPAWIELVERDGTRRWSQPLPGIPMAPGALSVGGGVAVIRIERFGEAAGDAAIVTQAYDVATGERRWETEQPDEEALRPSRVASDDRWLVTLDGTSTLTAIDRATGAVRWQHAVDANGVWVDLRLSDEHVVLESVLAVEFFSLPDGAHTELATRGAGCSVGDAYVALAERGEEVALVELDPDAPDEARTLAPSVRPDVPGGVRSFFVKACGTHGDLVVLTVAYEPLAEGAPPLQLGLLAVDRRSGATAFTVELGASFLGGSEGPTRERGAISGELQRFVPVLLADDSHGVAARLAVVDLEARAVVHAGTPYGDLVGCDVLRASARYAYLGGECGVGRQYVAIFDGQSGTLAAAFQSRTEVSITGPDLAGEGSLWLYRRWQGDAAPWVALDLAALAPDPSERSGLEEARDRMAGSLGLEDGPAPSAR